MAKYGEKDAHYYDLIYKMLKFESYKSLPLGSGMDNSIFNEQALTFIENAEKNLMKRAFIIRIKTMTLKQDILSGYSMNIR